MFQDRVFRAAGRVVTKRAIRKGKKKESSSKVMPQIITAGLGAGVLFALIHSAASRGEAAQADIEDQRNREDVARHIENAARRENLDALRAGTRARLQMGLMERGVVPMQGHRAAEAAYISHVSNREPTGSMYEGDL